MDHRARLVQRRGRPALRALHGDLRAVDRDVVAHELEAIGTMHRALSEYVIDGVKTTIPFHLQLMTDERFRSGNFNTKFIEGFTLK